MNEYSVAHCSLQIKSNSIVNQNRALACPTKLGKSIISQINNHVSRQFKTHKLTSNELRKFRKIFDS